MPAWIRRSSVVLVCAFLVAHVPYLPPALEDIDSINFAMGVESFDVPAHRPHPPGYPVFVALAKASTRVVAAVRPDWNRDRRAAAGLAALNVIAGSAALAVFAAFWRAVGFSPFAALLAGGLGAVSPLFWLSAARPLSDVIGLVAAVGVQALIVTGAARAREDRHRLPHVLAGAMFAMGLVTGLRLQTLWLTGPLALWSIAALMQAGRRRHAARLVLWTLAGMLIWAVPLVWTTGGPAAYVAALRSQGAEDFAGVQMLATAPNWRLFSAAMSRTFVDPWQVRWLAQVVSALALVGLALVARRRRPVLFVVAVAFLPYLVLHLAFQETATTRYALPMIVPVAGLAVLALEAAGTAAALGGVAVLASASLVIGMSQIVVYARDGSPIVRAFQDIQDAWRQSPTRPVLHMHHQVWWGVRRILHWYQPVWRVGHQPFPGDREWLAVVEHFRRGSRQPVYFLAHPTRPALATFDGRARTVSGRYELPMALDRPIGGVRLTSLIWHTIQPPNWMLDRGWALTPEMAGVTDEDRRAGRSDRPEAYLRRQDGALRMVLGGRYLGPSGGPPVGVDVTLDGRIVGSFRTRPEPRWFVQWLEVPEGTAAGDGPYATLAVDARTPSGSAAGALVGFEQFDAAWGDDPIFAFVKGWHEAESDPATGRSWRWTSGASVIDIRGGWGERTLVISGESPLRYFSQPPRVTVRAGAQVLKAFSPGSDFTERIAIPAGALGPAAGRVTIETDQVFSPSQSGSPDRRTLGLRLYSVELQ